ncbi:hypothetical protein OIU79_024578 [Salix purpurea]|uniref:Uncharacterized protein n=1 Tax=Salix purpurea TaxID=77065 RepID=A0A9Q0WE29_SALPP|nr:hypothetical protein OIU79_024578 [Salix purpurea]
MTTDEEQQQKQQKRESHQNQDVNLDLTIGLAPAKTFSPNSAESRLQQPVSSPCHLFGSVLTRPGCLCWQMDGERRELCRNCQNQNQSSKSNHNNNGLYYRYY